MAKHEYKLQEFVAHSSNINCLTIGKKSCRLLLTGGDNYKVNLWKIGNPTSLMSLCGHTTPVESVAFDSAEVLVVAGASSGKIKLWNVEEAKMVRSLTGHKSNCTAVAFHPFGEFFASGSMDSNLRIWDIRMKEGARTYKSHTEEINTIRFSPDGRWVVSGGLDNAVKIWDLTAGKLLHEFKHHKGHIRSIEFHPIEFLLATGSADKTVKFWDLETFELVGSSKPEATGVRSMTFHPDGRNIFCGLEDSLKVYSWEPMVRHDSVPMGWSTLGDLCIHEGKVLGCSYYQNSVGVWSADISLFEPYGDGFVTKQNDEMEYKFKLQGSVFAEKVTSMVKSSRPVSSDSDYKEIKNIYVDSTGGKPVTSQTSRSSNSAKSVLPSKSKEKSGSVRKSNILSRDTLSDKHSTSFRRDTKSSLVRSRRHSPVTDNSGSHTSRKIDRDNSVNNTSLKNRLMPEQVDLNEFFEENEKNIEILDQVDVDVPSVVVRDMSPEEPSADEKDDFTLEKQSSDCLVEPVYIRKPLENSFYVRNSDVDYLVNPSLITRFVGRRDSREGSEENYPNINIAAEKLEIPILPQKLLTLENVKRGRTRTLVEKFEKREVNDARDNDRLPILSYKVIPIIADKSLDRREVVDDDDDDDDGGTPVLSVQVMPVADQSFEMHEAIDSNDDDDHTSFLSYQVVSVEDETCITLEVEPEISIQEISFENDEKIVEELMQGRDVFMSTLRSRLAKLQVVRQVWERNDIKGAIEALRKFPDHSVQADVVSVLIEKTEILDLDLLYCILPMLTGLLSSKGERQAYVTLNLLLKLVRIFGPVIRSTITEASPVSFDLNAKQRVECCKRCLFWLQKIQKFLPQVVRRGGDSAKCALELNLLLQES